MYYTNLTHLWYGQTTLWSWRWCSTIKFMCNIVILHQHKWYTHLPCCFTASTHCLITCWKESKSIQPSTALSLIMWSNNSSIWPYTITIMINMLSDEIASCLYSIAHHSYNFQWNFVIHIGNWNKKVTMCFVLYL